MDNRSYGLGFVVRTANGRFYSAESREGGGVPGWWSAARGLAGAGRDSPAKVADGKGIGGGGGVVSVFTDGRRVGEDS